MLTRLAATHPERGDGLPLPIGLRELAERLAREPGGLPAYVYDLDALGAHLAAIRAAVGDRVEVCYAIKANPDPALLRVITRYADGLEVSSAGELAHATAVAPGARLSFGGPGKTSGELAAALSAGTFRFHVESPHELRLLGAAALAAGRVADILLRVNLPGRPEAASAASAGSASPASLVMGGLPSPFGMGEDLLDQCAQWLAEGSPPARRLRLRGIHAHLASGLSAPALLDSALHVLEFGRSWCAAHDVRAPEFNLGGGMSVDYRDPGTRFDWGLLGRGLTAAARPGETLRIEPGRSVTAYCGWYITPVLDVKRSQGQAFAIVAGGTHHLRTPVAKGHDQPFVVLPVPAWPHDWPRPAAEAEPVTIVGQLCTPKDVLARQVTVGQLRSADLLAFGLAGAYAWNISHHDFLMHPEPSFHYLGAGGSG